MPNNLAIQSPEWQAAKDAVASGLTLSHVAEKLGLDYERLKKRAQRESWPRPHLAVRQAKEAHKALVRANTEGTDKSRSVPDGFREGMTAAEKTGTLILESAQELAESGSYIGLKLLHGQLKDAQVNQRNLAPIVDAKGIVTAIRGVRLAAGLDKQGPVVSLNLWGDAAPSRVVPGTTQDVPEIEQWDDE